MTLSPSFAGRSSSATRPSCPREERPARCPRSLVPQHRRPARHPGNGHRTDRPLHDRHHGARLRQRYRSAGIPGNRGRHPATESRGTSGFGYDPVLTPDTDSGHRTYAQMTSAETGIGDPREGADYARGDDGPGYSETVSQSRFLELNSAQNGLPADRPPGVSSTLYIPSRLHFFVMPGMNSKSFEPAGSTDVSLPIVSSPIWLRSAPGVVLQVQAGHFLDRLADPVHVHPVTPVAAWVEHEGRAVQGDLAALGDVGKVCDSLVLVGVYISEVVAVTGRVGEQAAEHGCRSRGRRTGWPSVSRPSSP